MRTAKSALPPSHQVWCVRIPSTLPDLLYGLEERWGQVPFFYTNQQWSYKRAMFAHPTEFSIVPIRVHKGEGLLCPHPFAHLL